MSATYKVTVKGVAPSVPVGEAIKNLASLFKVSEAQVQNLIASGNAVVKKNISLQDAAKYQAAIEKCGATVVVEPEFESGLSFDVAQTTTQPQIAETSGSLLNGAMPNANAAQFAGDVLAGQPGMLNITKWGGLTLRQKINKAVGILFVGAFGVVILAKAKEAILPSPIETFIDPEYKVVVMLYDKIEPSKCNDWKMANWFTPTESEAKFMGIENANRAGFPPGNVEGCWRSEPGSLEVFVTMGVGRNAKSPLTRKIEQPINQKLKK